MDPSDGSLFDRWRENRDGDAFAELARRHSATVFDLTTRVLGDRAGAEDVLQEALLNLALEESRKPVEVGVVAWLCRFAICRARNRRASERCRTRRQIAVGTERPEEVMPDEGLAQKDELERALGGCDPEDRALLAMRFLHDWDYDRIAAALSISEGAARVRVHRALHAVRSRLGVDDRAAIGRLALAPVAMLPAGFEAKLGSLIDVAKVRLGAPPNGLEHATASSRGLRLALRAAGAAMALVAAVGSAEIAIDAGAGAGSAVSVAESADVSSARGGPAGLVAAATAPSRGDHAERRFFPRPDDWDLGAMASLDAVRGGGTVAASGAAVSAPRNDGNAAADDRVAGVPAGPRPDGDAVAANDLDLPDALRPMERAACAAKGGTVSSDDERAGAFGGSGSGGEPAAGLTTPVAAAPDEVAEDRADTAAAAPEDPVVGGRATGGISRGRRAATSVERVPFDTLTDEEKALVAEAEGLLRKYIDAELASIRDGDSTRRQVRAVRSKVGKLRRESLGGDAIAATARRGTVGVSRVVSLLAAQVLESPGSPGGVLWPRGADAETALKEVIELLSAATQASLPSGVE